MTTAVKRILQNVLIMSVSVMVATLGAEALSRVILDPVDYLNPILVPDDFLNHRIDGYTGGHDEWGFRNIRRPQTADIVCIGDSLTYGVSAQAKESWPAVLGKLRAETVYNMALGGYGPIQYLHLMRAQAVQLHPKTVIVGFYFGNDLLDVYNVARFNTKWSEYAVLGDATVKGPAFIFPRKPGKFLGGLRDWLSKHSVLYSIVTQLPAFEFVRVGESVNRVADASDNLVPFRDDRHNVIFNLSPQSRFLDTRDPRIKSAMEITKRVFSDMRSVASKNGMRLIVVLIPTKERVYSQLMKKAGYIDRYPRLGDAIDQENLVRDEIEGDLTQLKIETLDLLPSLEASVGENDLFPRTDSHPNKQGYLVIAKTINRYLDDQH